MKIKLLCVGKNNSGFIEEGVALYCKRIKKYVPFEINFTKTVKKTKTNDDNYVKKTEGDFIIKQFGQSDYVILLDERGEMISSKGFSTMIQHKINSQVRNLWFVTGGALGFSDEVYNRCDFKMAISRMTFPHQLVRIMFLEQLYRAFTILNNEPYHNE